ncbi:MAG: metallophosphoesterase [Myxococcaceae bacterium]|nr:MAG: metallophosphoesterase [Myxococcaceae bacterium]
MPRCRVGTIVHEHVVLRLAHLSDLHHQIDWRMRPFWSSGWRGAPGRFELHALGRLRRFLGVEQRIARLVDQVLSLAPDRVIVTGDLTALGDQDELRHARALLEPFIAAGLLVVIPGNHDRYADARHAAFEVVFRDLLTSDLPELADEHGYPFVKLVGEQHALVGLDSTRVQGWSHYLVGRLGARQLRALARVLEHPCLERRTVLLLAHHGPAGPSGSFDWNESGLIDADALLRTIRDRRVVLLHGHSHHRYWHRAHGGRPHLIAGGSSTERPGFWEVQVDDHRALQAVAHPLR